MAQFIELMRYALSMTRYEDAYIKQYGKENKSERNFQTKIFATIYAPYSTINVAYEILNNNKDRYEQNCHTNKFIKHHLYPSFEYYFEDQLFHPNSHYNLRKLEKKFLDIKNKIKSKYPYNSETFLTNLHTFYLSIISTYEFLLNINNLKCTNLDNSIILYEIFELATNSNILLQAEVGKGGLIYSENEEDSNEEIRNAKKKLPEIISDITNKYFKNLEDEINKTLKDITKQKPTLNTNKLINEILSDLKSYEITLNKTSLQTILTERNTLNVENIRVKKLVTSFISEKIASDNGILFYPDLLFHKPKSMQYQKLICELKLEDKVEKYQYDISKLIGYVNALKYEEAYFICLTKTNQKNLDMLRAIAVANFEEDLKYMNKIFIWFFKYDERHITTNPNEGHWVCMPFPIVCERFHNNGNGDLEYTEGDLRNWLVDNANV